MLILSRRAGEAILLAGGIRVIVIATERGQVRLGIEAPPEVTILRQEIVDDVTAGTVAAVATPEALARLGFGPIQPAVSRSRRRAAASVGADQNATPSDDSAITESPSARKRKRKAVAEPAAESQASSS
jgi:carbon storage regulator